jgi:hypothetical protein
VFLQAWFVARKQDVQSSTVLYDGGIILMTALLH